MGSFQLKVKSENNEICLVGVNGINVTTQGVFDDLPLYEGQAFYESDEKILVDTVFYKGELTHITKIEECSFSHCKSLREIYISQYVKSINWNMYGCEKLENIYVDSRNGFYTDIEGVLYKKAFGGVNKLVGFPSGRTGKYSILNGVNEICNCAFKSSKLSQIDIPDSVEVIGSNVFYMCNNLNEIVLPKNLRVFRLNCNPKQNRKLVPVPQRFYLFDDKNKLHPYNSFEISEMFPE